MIVYNAFAHILSLLILSTLRKMEIITFSKWFGGREECPGTDGHELKNKGHDHSSSFKFSWHVTGTFAHLLCE